MWDDSEQDGLVRYLRHQDSGIELIGNKKKRLWKERRDWRLFLSTLLYKVQVVVVVVVVSDVDRIEASNLHSNSLWIH
jgi:hypothetical protein